MSRARPTSPRPSRGWDLGPAFPCPARVGPRRGMRDRAPSSPFPACGSAKGRHARTVSVEPHPAHSVLPELGTRPHRFERGSRAHGSGPPWSTIRAGVGPSPARRARLPPPSTRTAPACALPRAHGDARKRRSRPFRCRLSPACGWRRLGDPEHCRILGAFTRAHGVAPREIETPLHEEEPLPRAWRRPRVSRPGAGCIPLSCAYTAPSSGRTATFRRRGHRRRARHDPLRRTPGMVDPRPSPPDERGPTTVEGAGPRGPIAPVRPGLLPVRDFGRRRARRSPPMGAGLPATMSSLRSRRAISSVREDSRSFRSCATMRLSPSPPYVRTPGTGGGCGGTARPSRPCVRASLATGWGDDRPEAVPLCVRRSLSGPHRCPRSARLARACGAPANRFLDLDDVSPSPP